MSDFFETGADYSANALSDPPTAHLLKTIPAFRSRLGFFVMNLDTADTVYVVFDKDGTDTSTIAPLDPAPTAGGMGGSVTAHGMPHNGRIRIYGTNSTTKMTARVWPA